MWNSCALFEGISRNIKFINKHLNAILEHIGA